jgi:diaminopimelate epimerase
MADSTIRLIRARFILDDRERETIRFNCSAVTSGGPEPPSARERGKISVVNTPASNPSSAFEPLQFLKMSGAGNDFVVIDDRTGRIADPQALARIASVRRLSVGFDGLILIRDSDQASFRMLYFNADGSVGDFCANGTRCAARFALLRSIAPSRMTIETGHAIVGAEVDEGEVTLSIPPPEECVLERPLRLGDGSVVHGAYLMVGVPHYVIFVEEDLWGMDISPLGREIRRHPDLPHGANVNFVSASGGGNIAVRTWERGVEGETLACGSGVVASSAASLLTGRATAPVAVLTRSGITLGVEMSRSGEASVEQVRLTGDARVVYEGTMTPETLEGFDPEWVTRSS